MARPSLTKNITRERLISIGKELRLQRLNLGLPQKLVAEITHYSLKSISNLENGRIGSCFTKAIIPDLRHFYHTFEQMKRQYTRENAAKKETHGGFELSKGDMKRIALGQTITKLMEGYAKKTGGEKPKYLITTAETMVTIKEEIFPENFSMANLAKKRQLILAILHGHWLGDDEYIDVAG